VVLKWKVVRRGPVNGGVTQRKRIMPLITQLPALSNLPPTRVALVTSLAAGGIGGAALFATVGTISERTVFGGVSGAAIGAIIGWGCSSGLVSPAVIWLCCFAVAGAFIGRGCDADALSSAILFGAVGAFIGHTRWSGLIAIVGALVAVNIHPSLFFLFIFGAWLYFARGVFDVEKHAPDN
jgi:hypothetical protein